MTRIALATFGCKANQADTDALRDSVAHQLDGNATFVGIRDAADIVVFNTCTVTHNADADARQAIRRARRESPDAQIVVTGCYAQTNRDALLEIPEIDHIVGNENKAGVAGLVAQLAQPDASVTPLQAGDWQPELREPQAITSLPPGRSRPFVKVQDGCSYVCSFCIIPRARGESRSLSLEHVVQTVQRLEANGAREVVLTGIHLGHWGRDMTPRRSFASLLKGLIDQTESVRFRISSLEPNEVDTDLFDLMAAEPRLCRHLHVPLQSGDDTVLSRMRRVYRSAHYTRIFEAYRERFPQGGWGIDVMVGFPGETDEHFQNTYRYLRGLDFTYLHVFTFSARHDTDAAAMSGQVAGDVKKERNRILTGLSNEHQARHAARQIGREERVVVESRRIDGRLRGYTDNYVATAFDGSDALMDAVVAVQIEESQGGLALGAVIEHG